MVSEREVHRVRMGLVMGAVEDGYQRIQTVHSGEIGVKPVVVE